jgi:hypothetical protein
MKPEAKKSKDIPASLLPSCGGCRFFQALIRDEGECRISPPAFGAEHRWPTVHPQEWCGRYESRDEWLRATYPEER